MKPLHNVLPEGLIMAEERKNKTVGYPYTNGVKAGRVPLYLNPRFFQD